jgi:hypothetical protein
MIMGKPKDPIELVDRYLQAIRFWLPKNVREEDLLVELGDDLRSQIEAKEADLGRPLAAEEVSEILKRCGAPMVVAGRMGPRKSLIGPSLYPIYIFVLKMVLFWILTPVFLWIVGPINLANSGSRWPIALFNTFGQLWSALFIAAGIITLVFVILERSSAQVAIASKFDPLSLPPVQKTERKPSTLQTVCQLVFGIFGLVWLLLIPNYPFLILGPAAAFLHASALIHRSYVPIVLLSLLALLRSVITLARPQWSWFPKVSELVQALFTLILVNFLLDASGHMTNGEWHPFLVVGDVAKDSVQYIKVAAIVNVSILLSLVGTWIGLSIAMIIQTWQLIRQFRKRRIGTGQAATLQLQ